MEEPQSKWIGTTFGAATAWTLFENPPAGSYVFRNRFDLKSNGRFKIDASSYTLSAASDDHVVLTALKPEQKIQDCDTLILWGGPYPDRTSATHAGRKWRQIAISVFPHFAIGCDFGDDDAENLDPVDEPLHIRGMFNLTESDHVFRDRIGLLVLPAKNLPAAFVSLRMEAVGYSGLDDLPRLITAAEQRYTGVWADDLRLAYNLVHAGLNATEDPEARYIFTVTAIEALIPHREKHPDLSKALDQLASKLDELQGFDADTIASVKQSLENNKRDSVNKFGRELAGRLSGQYGGKDPNIFWRDSYKLRSGLAHGNIRTDTTRQALHTEFLELLRFVLDILEAWTENPGFQTVIATNSENGPTQGDG